MTKIQLKKRLRRVFYFIFGYFAILIVHHFYNKDYFEFCLQTMPLFIIIISAYVANIYHKRSVFVSTLREVWYKIVDAKVEIYEFIDNRYSSEDDLRKVYTKWSSVIDYVRAVYKNVGESKTYKGYYPFESLHDIRKILRDYSITISEDEKNIIKDKIFNIWQTFRFYFLSELEPPQPTMPITEQNFVIKRKNDTDPSIKN